MSKRDASTLLLLLAMLLWFSHEMVWSGKVPFFRDLGPFFYPMRFVLAESLKAGTLPLWDRHMGMGFPFLANFQLAAFYPPHLFLLALPFFTAIQALFLFHTIVAAAGAYLLSRRWHYPPYLALIGSVLFALGGAVVSLTNLLNHFQAAVWLPWVLLMGERFFITQSWKNFLLFTFTLVFQFLAGSPEIYAMSMVLLCLDGLRLRAIEGSFTRRRLYCLIVAGNVLVAGLAMIQILPTAELFLESRGRTSVGYPTASSWSLQPLNLLNLFLLDKKVDTTLPGGVGLFFVRQVPFFISHYLGAISLVGVFLWLSSAPRKEKGVLLTLIIASLALTLGRYTPVHPFLYQLIPFFDLIRFPEKFFFITSGLLLFITLRGLHGFFDYDHPTDKKSLLLLSLITILWVILFLFIRLETSSLVQFITWAKAPPFSSTPLGISAILFSLERQMVLMIGIFLVIVLWKNGKIRTNLFQALIVGLVFFDLTSAHRPHQFLLDADLVYKSPRVLAEPSSERDRIFYYPPGSSLHPSYVSIPGRPSFPEMVGHVFSILRPNAGIFHGFEYMQEIDALGRWPYRAFLNFANKLSPEKRFRLLGRLNVRYIIALRPLTHEGVTLVRHFPEHSSWLYRVDRIIPRAYIASKVIVEGDPGNILKRLSSKEFDPLNEIMLERPLSVPAKEKIQAKVEIVNYTNNHVRIRATLDSPGVLVLADSYYPGWRVFVDGEEKEILRANMFFRGVSLSPGDHVVDFRYEPLSFTIGLVFSLTTFFGVIAATVLFSVRRRKKSASTV